jgi:PPOX class probable F420-dependent enzyme
VACQAQIEIDFVPYSGSARHSVFDVERSIEPAPGGASEHGQDDVGNTQVSDSFAAFRAHKYAMLTTYKRDGNGVATPVTFAVVDDIAYVRTYTKTWKYKRLRNYPNVLVAPSTFRGKKLGPDVEATARRVTGAEEQRARAAIGHRQPVLQGVVVPLLHKLRRYETVHYALTPGAAPGGWPQSMTRNG